MLISILIIIHYESKANHKKNHTFSHLVKITKSIVSSKLSGNYIFCKFECGLSKNEASESWVG